MSDNLYRIVGGPHDGHTVSVTVVPFVTDTVYFKTGDVVIEYKLADRELFFQREIT